MLEREPSSHSKVPVSHKIAWGVGGLACDMVNALWILALPIFSVGLGVKASLMGLALALPRIVDGVLDPVLGSLSDNTHSRWGRRRPYILVGAIGMGVCFALMWTPNRTWGEMGLFTWFTVFSILYFVFFTIWNIPWTALGYEITPDVKERNSVQAFRSWFSTGAAFLLPAIMPLAIYFGKSNAVEGVPHEVQGVVLVGLIAGGVMILSAIPAAIFIKERPEFSSLPRVPFIASAKATLKNRSFLWLCLYAALFCGGVLVVSPMSYYLNVFYVYKGLPLQEAKEASSHVMFWGGIVGAASNLVAVPLIAMCANRFGKKATLLGGIVLVAVGQFLKWNCWSPEHPSLQIWLSVLIYPGLILTWTIVPSMIADLCDIDELENGERREGMYSATFGLILKVGVTIAMALSGWLITASGIIDTDESQTLESIMNLRVLFAVLPSVLTLLGGVFILKYPVTEAMAEEVKAKLAGRHELTHG